MVYVTRHGSTPNTESRDPVLQGRRADPDLTPRGREQAELLGAVMATRRIDAIYHGSQRRHVATAWRVLVAVEETRDEAVPTRVCAGLDEIDHGDWEGRSWEDVRRDDPEGFVRFRDDPAGVGFPGGETYQQLLARAWPVVERAVSEFPAGRVLLVTSKQVCRVLAAKAQDADLNDCRELEFSPCGITALRFFDGRFVGQGGWNHVDHLVPDVEEDRHGRPARVS